jgi:hypothetical protein
MSNTPRWATRPAKWYQFWRPQSGIIGGFIFGGLLVSLAFIAVAA